MHRGGEVRKTWREKKKRRKGEISRFKSERRIEARKENTRQKITSISGQMRAGSTAKRRGSAKER